MITYNHEKYIREAVDSVMNQVSDFVYKLFIGEDGSTDRTRELCLELQSKYKSRIELILNESNVGATENAHKVYNACFNSGAKYIAMIEGDDYWTDPLKLKKQIDILEGNSDLSLCGHLVETQKIDVREKDTFKTGLYTIDSVIQEGRICHTVSMIFRNVLQSRDLEFMKNVYAKEMFFGGDILLSLLILSRGNAFVMDEYMAVYRKHSGGITQASHFSFAFSLGAHDMLSEFNKLTNHKYRSQIIRKQKSLAEHVVKKETNLRNKLKACAVTFQVDFLYGVKLLAMLPVFTAKSLLFVYFKRGKN